MNNSEHFKYPAILALNELTNDCMKLNFSTNSLNTNRKLLEKVEKFQSLIFDRQQIPGNSSYEKQPIENELSHISLLLRTEISFQLARKVFGEQEPVEKIFNFFTLAYHLNSSNPDYYGVERDPIDEDLLKSAQNYLAEIILERTEMSETYLPLLVKMKEYYNCGDIIFMQIEKIQKNTVR